MEDRVLISQVASRVQKLGIPGSDFQRKEPVFKWQAPPCYWECVVQSNGTFTAGVDWFPQFDPSPSITNQVRFRQATAGGELEFSHPEGGSDMGARRAVLQVYAHQPQTVSAAGTFTGTSSRVQFGVNGNLTEVAGPYSDYFTFDLVEGYNTITVCTNTAVDELKFTALVFDGTTVFWVNPNAPKNPVYEGFLAQSSASGFGSTTGESGSTGMGVGSE